MCFKMLRNASKCFALRLGSSTIHQATATTLPTTQRPHGGYAGATRVPVKTGQCHPKRHRSRPYSPSSFCKPLQNAAICFNLHQNALQENAIFCNGMLRIVSFCFVHTCAPLGVPKAKREHRQLIAKLTYCGPPMTHDNMRANGVRDL